MTKEKRNRFWGLFNTGNIIFLALLTLFVTAILRFFSYMPIWDGFNFMSCYMKTADKFTPECFGHSAVFNNFLFSLSQKIDFGNPKIVYVFNLVLGVLALVCFYFLLKHLFRNKLSPTELVLATFFLGLNPIFMANAIQPGLDYVLPIYVIILLLCLFKRKIWFLPIIGLMLCFTKEPGVMLYAVVSVLYLLFFINRERPSKRLQIQYFIAILLPLLTFGIYCYFNKLHTSAGGEGSVMEYLTEMILPNRSSAFFVSQMQSIAVINFAWIISFSIIAGLIYFLAKPQKENSDSDPGIIYFGWPRVVLYFVACAALIIWFLTRVEFYNNPRYMLPVLPFFLILFFYAYQQIKLKKIRVFFLVSILGLIYASAFFTFDPLAKMVFGVFKFGNHDILDMRTGEGSFRGRDLLVYNFQYTYFRFLTDEIMDKYGKDKIYIINNEMSFINMAEFSIDHGKAKLGLNDFPPLDFSEKKVKVESDQGAFNGDYSEFYFIEFPGRNNEKSYQLLLPKYQVELVDFVEKEGYSLRVVHFTKP